MVKAKKAVRVHTQKKASPLFGHLLAGVAVCTAVLAGLLCASAALLCRVDIPLEMTVPLGTGALCLSVLAGSTVTSLIHGKNGLLCGLLFGSIAVVFVGRHARPTVVFYLHSHQGRQYFTVWWGRRVRRHFMEGKP